MLLKRRAIFISKKIASRVADEHLDALRPVNYHDQLFMIFSTCPHLLHLSQLYAANNLKQILNANWRLALENLNKEFFQKISDAQNDKDAILAIRVYKNQSNYVISLSEMLGFLTIEESCKLLSELSEYAIQQTLTFLLRQKEVKSPEDCGLAILALGKLGAKELNYSSDIDLIFLHKTSYNNSSKNFIELCKKLIHMLSSPSKDGNGWRIDMRLRPNPSSTHISLDISAAVVYYESIARSWERAAFIRARPIAGDKQLAKEFLSKIEPFIWRGTLDYSVVEDLQNWLRHYPVPKEYLGYDVKLGAFGIRHVELITHILQLLGGGRNFNLRTENTSDALIKLENAGWIGEDKSNALISCYYAWRRIEHRLQYQRDTQTHKLPRSENEFTEFAYLLGYENSFQFREALYGLQEFTKNSASHPILSNMMLNKDSTKSTSIILPQESELIIEWISQLGFGDEKSIQNTIQEWLEGGIAATSSERSRTYLTRLLPKMLPQIAKADFPKAAFAAFQDIISSLPAGVQIFALLEHNPSLIGLLSNILVKAPRLTEILRYNSYLIDDLLENQFFQKLPNRVEINTILSNEIANASTERALDLIRKKNKSWQFQADLHLLEALSDLDEIANFRSSVAGECLRKIIQLALEDLSLRHGIIENRYEIIALGRLASNSLTANSDLDLILVYENKHKDTWNKIESLGTSSYFIRLTQLITNWMSLKTSHGTLYQLDLRLRPDGNAGPIAVSIERLSSYYQNEAWIWEFFAFRNARLLLNETNFSNEVYHVIDVLNSRVFKRDELISAFRDIREKRKSKAYPFWNLKQQHGGLLDCSIALFILEKLEKKYPSILKRLNNISSRLDNIIQQLSTRLISYNHNELPDQVMHFIAVQLNYKNAKLLKKQVCIDLELIKKILTILLDNKILK